jgi:hypothetical protein
MVGFGNADLSKISPERLEELRNQYRQKGLQSSYNVGKSQGSRGEQMDKDYLSKMGESELMDKHLLEYSKGYVEGREAYNRQTGKARRKHRKGKKHTRRHKRHSRK